MNHSLQVYRLQDIDNPISLLGTRPLVTNNQRAMPQIVTPRGLHVNSMLRKDEWEELDRAVVRAAVPPLRVTAALERAGLTSPLGSLGTLVSQYNVVSEMTGANANLRGHSTGDKDLVDFDIRGVPVPVIFKEFELDARALASGRMLGEGIDVVNAAAAARVVAEKVEDMVINGDNTLNLNGNIVYGLTNHPNIITDTAINFGGGDWATAGNPEKTVLGMIGAAQGQGYYGPYAVFAASTQYNESLLYHTDGSGDTGRDRILRLPGVTTYEQVPQLVAGVILLVTLSIEVVDLKRLESYWPVTNLEWASGDGMQVMFKALTVFTPRIKAAYGGKSGIVKATGA